MPMPRTKCLGAVAALILLCGLAIGDARSDSATPAPRPLIGMAFMKPDGTIVLDLYGGRETNYALGHLKYPPGHKDYRAILTHLGGLAPGERKGVPPWPDQP
jgi:hypothetical protein